MQVLARETASPESHDIQSNEASRQAENVSKRRHIVCYARQPANHCVAADPYHLMYCSTTAKKALLPELDVPAKHDIIRQNHPIAYFAVMTHVAARHQQAICSDNRYALTAHAAAVNGNVLPQVRACSDPAAGWLTTIL